MRSVLLAFTFGGVLPVVACGSSGESTFPNAGGDGADGGGIPLDDGGSPFADSGAPPDDVLTTDVDVVITTDNAFSFGYGDATTLDTFVQGVPSNGPEIFDCPVDYGPEPFTVPGEKAPSNAWLYIIAWADTEVTQGALAQFKRDGGKTIYSGDGNWQVCATGQFFDGNGNGPDPATVNQYLGQCNAGAGGTTYSKGWVNTTGAVTPGAIGKLAFGEANDDPGGNFPIVCQVDANGVRGIDAQARWMWFDPLDDQSPFVGNAGNRTKTFLIFRLPASALSIR